MNITIQAGKLKKACFFQLSNNNYIILGSELFQFYVLHVQEKSLQLKNNTPPHFTFINETGIITSENSSSSLVGVRFQTS